MDHEKLTIRYILLWAAAGALAVGLCTAIVSTTLFLDRLKDGARARIAHAAEVGAISIGEFLRRSTDVVWQVTSRSKARRLLVELNAGTIAPDDYRRQTQNILTDALNRSDHLRAIARLDKDHRRVASVGEEIPEHLLPKRHEMGRAAIVSGPFALKGAMRIAVSAPILDRQGEPVGADVTLFGLEQLAHLLTAEVDDDHARWELSYFLAVTGDGTRTYYAPSASGDEPIAPVPAEILLGEGDDAEALARAGEDIVSIGDLVFATRSVDGSDWMVLVRKSTAHLYSGVYGDMAVSLIAGLVLSGGGALCLLVLIRHFARKLTNQLGGLRRNIAASEARYRDLIEESVQGILIHRDYRPLLVNKAWAEIHGYGVEEIMSLDSIEPLISPQDRGPLSEYRNARQEGGAGPDRHEYRAVHKNGKPIWVETSVKEIAWDGAPATQTTMVDITDRKEREATDAIHRSELESLVRQRTMEIEEKSRNLEIALRKEREYSSLLDQFVSMASHEFRTPLTIIDSVAQRQFRKADDLRPKSLKESAQKIRGAVQRMILLIESLLSSASMDAGKFKMKPQACSLRDVVSGVCLREQELSPRHEIISDLDRLPEQIAGDPGMLEQVFANLLSNAVKYSPGSPRIEVVGAAQGGYASVTVIDQGLGIPAEEQPKLFDRFFRASTSSGIAGTGIGLNLVAQIVELHGGRVDVESAQGRGSKFTVRLPIRTLPEPPAEVLTPAMLSPAAQTAAD